MTGNELSIAVVGGGLGGMATTVALGRAGFAVEVFEQASKLGEIGAGINISNQATKALMGIGLGPQLAAAGNVITGQTMRSMYTGEVLSETVFSGERGAGGRFSAPYYVLHRADLLDILADAPGLDRVHLDHRLVDIADRGDDVELEFANGQRRVFDVVIAADGIHSRVRERLYGADEATFAGQMVWRAFLDGSAFGEDVLGPHGFTGWMGRGTHMMVYFLRGREIINITAQTDSAAWVEEGWSIAGDPDEMRAAFPDAEPRLQPLLDGITRCSKWGLFGRQPSTDWGTGRVQLIGDAAHPMLPNAGQGAAQAFEDAYVLGRWLDAGRDDPVAALERFRDVRIPRAHAVQRQTMVNTKLLHSGDWESRQDTFKAREAKGDTPLGLGWIYDYEPEQEWSVRKEYPLSFEPAARS